MKKPLVSVLVLNYNNKQYLKDFFNSLYAIINIKDCEVFLIDNASADGSVEFTKKNFLKVKIVQNDKNYGTAGYNFGIRHCKGKFILFLAPDMELQKNSVVELVKVFDDQTIGQATPKLINFFHRNLLDGGGSWLSRCMYGNRITKELGHKKPFVIPYVGTGMVRMDVLEKIKYIYDPDFFLYSEDVDLGMRIRLAGYKVVLVPNSIMYHMGSVTNVKVHPRPKLTYLMERNSFITFFKIFQWHNIVIFMPYVFGMRVIAILRDLFIFQFKNAFARLKAIIWVVFHIGFILRKRRETQKIRVVSDRTIYSVFSEREFFKSIFGIK